MKHKKIYSKYYLLTKEYVARCGYNDRDNKLSNYSSHLEATIQYKIHININLVKKTFKTQSENKVSLLRK